jgi:hypothetical protein
MPLDCPMIIFDADPFCFGPISTTLSIVERLRLRSRLPEGTRLVLLATLTSTQLASKSGLFDAIHECNTTCEASLREYTELITDASLYVSNTNPASIGVVARMGTPVVYIDTLFWMWDDVTADLRFAEKVFIQYFHGVEENIARLGHVLKEYKIVGPIAPAVSMDKNPRETSDGLLITLGGIDTVYAETTDFWFQFLQDLLALPCVMEEKKITIAGGGETIARIADTFSKSHPHIVIGCFSRDEFIACLRKARKVLANPGLTTFYECLSMEKDVFFLPPQNYSQQLQLEVYLRDYYSAGSGCPWTPDYGYPVIPRHMPEKEGIELINQCTGMFLARQSERRRALGMIDDFMRRDAPSLLSERPSEKFPSDMEIVGYIEDAIAGEEVSYG